MSERAAVLELVRAAETALDRNRARLDDLNVFLMSGYDVRMLAQHGRVQLAQRTARRPPGPRSTGHCRT